MYVIHFRQPLMSFVAETEEEGFHEAAGLAGLDDYEISPLAHKSRRMVLRDRTGEIVAISVRCRNTLRA